MKTTTILITAGLLAIGPLAQAAPPEGGMMERSEMMQEREGMQEERAEMMQERTESMQERAETMEERGEMMQERTRTGEHMQEQQHTPQQDMAEGEAHGMGMSRGEVARAAFATAIEDREPVDKVEKLPADHQKVYFFTELRDMAGQTVTHRWEHDGKVQAEVKFNVKGPRWRVWSSKNLPTDATGEWKVSVVNGNGEVIAEDVVNITPPEAADLDTTGTATNPAP